MVRVILPQPTLLQGISQQPIKSRPVEKAARQVNFHSSPISGLQKRPALEHVKNLISGVGGSNRDVAVHTIDRDLEERYEVVVGQNEIRIFDLEGREYDVRDRTGEISDSPHTNDFAYVDLRTQTFELGANTRANFLPPSVAEDFTPSPGSWATNPSANFIGTGEVGPLGWGTFDEISVDAGAVDGFFELSNLSEFKNVPVSFSLYVNATGVLSPTDVVTLVLHDADEALDHSVSFDIDGSGVVTVGTATTGMTGTVELIRPGVYRIHAYSDSSLLPTTVPGNVLEPRVQLQADAAGDRALNVFGAFLIEDPEPTSLTSYVQDARSQLGFLTVQDFTFVTQRQMSPRISTTSLDSTFEQIYGKETYEATPEDVKDAVYIWIRQGGFAQTYELSIATQSFGGATVKVVTKDDPSGPGFGSGTSDIAEALRNKLDGLDTVDAIVDPTFLVHTNVKTSGSVLKLTTDSSFREIFVKDSLGGSSVVVIRPEGKGTLANASDLPPSATANTRVRVIGQPLQDRDDVGYIVRFQPGNVNAPANAFTDGKWIEGRGFSVFKSFNTATMPHRLVRQQYDEVGDFADGVAAVPPGTPREIYFEWLAVDYTEREVGNDDLNARPTFLAGEGSSRPIVQDIVFFKGRLGFLSDQNVVFSEVDRFFNFWRTTTRQVLDADRIDTTVRHTKPSVLKFGQPFNERLFLYSDRTQFVLDGQPVLTPATVATTPITEFRASRRVRPVLRDTFIYFIFDREEQRFVGLRRLTPTTDEVFDAPETSLAIPRFIPDQERFLTVDGKGQSVVIGSTGAPNKLFVLKTLFEGAQELQNSWSEFQFDPADVILDAQFVSRFLFLLIQRQDGLFLDRLELVDRPVDAFSTFQVHLDRRVKDTDCSPVFAAGETTFTLPYQIPAGATVQAVTRATESASPGTLKPVKTQGSNTVVLAGDESLTPLWLGLPYRAEYETSQVEPRERTGRGVAVVTTGDLLLYKGRLAFDFTGSVEVVLNGTARPEIVVPFVSKDPSLPEPGELEFGVGLPAEQSTVTFRSDSHLPVTLINLEWDADLVARGSRQRVS